jgi:phosphotriesterase-related protein
LPVSGVLRLLPYEGLAPERVICGHMDERLDVDYYRRTLATGANLGFDTFGSELYFSRAFHHPSDDQRMTHLAQLVAEDFADRIVLAHDVAVKAHLRAFGGNGYDHLLERIVPELRRRFAMDQDVLDLMLVGNPRRLLTCNPPARSGGGPGVGLTQESVAVGHVTETRMAQGEPDDAGSPREGRG